MRSEKKKTKMKNRQGKKKKREKKKFIYIHTHSHSLSVGWHQLHSYHRPPSFFFLCLSRFIYKYISTAKVVISSSIQCSFLFFPFLRFLLLLFVFCTTQHQQNLSLLGIDTVSTSCCFQRLLFFLSLALPFFFFFFFFCCPGLVTRLTFFLCTAIQNYLLYTPTVLHYPIIEQQQQSFLRMSAQVAFYVDGSNLIEFLNVKSCIKKVNITCLSLLLPLLNKIYIRTTRLLCWV